MTSKTRTKAIILASVCAGALSGLAIEPITNIAYRNDFGTNALVGGLTWSSTVGLGIVEGPAMPGDLDGDGLFCAVRCQTSDTHRYGKKNFYAPIPVIPRPA